jgi:phosphatidylinositol alpha-1,6-mannosyltransferase
VWHIGLLKLLPFFRAPNARVALFLHGIEAWTKHDWLTRTLLRRIDLFLTNSDHTWRRFLETNPLMEQSPHMTTHLGLLESVRGGIPKPDDLPIALMVGRLRKSEDYKGHREVFGAWPHVLRWAPTAQLWIVGAGDLRHDLEEIAAARRFGTSVRFLGEVSDDEKQALLLRCRCLVLPSRAEGFGLVYAEAMRLGRPCVVSTIDAGREIVNPPEAGLAANPTDPHALASAMCRLLSKGSSWQQFSGRARARYDANFTATHFQHRLRAALGTFN